MAEEQAAETTPPAQGGKPGGFLGKLRDSFEKHKQLYALGIAAAGLLITYLIWKQTQNASGTNTLVTGTSTDSTGASSPTIPTPAPPGSSSTPVGSTGGGGGTVVPPSSGPFFFPSGSSSDGSTGGGGGGGGSPFPFVSNQGPFNSQQMFSANSTSGAASGIPPTLPIATLNVLPTGISAAPLQAIAAKPSSPSVLKAATLAPAPVKAVTMAPAPTRAVAVASLTPIKSSAETTVMPPRIGGYHAA